VLVSERIDCSLVIGPWAPSVVLCRADMERLTPEELRGLLAHELAHVRRQDLWTGFLPNLARLVFFFDPLVWLACREYDLAREAACDAEALRVSGMPLAAYGRLLLKLGVTSAAATAPQQRSPVGALGAVSPDGVLLRRRLQSLQSLMRGSSGLPRWRGAFLLGAAVGLLSLTPVRSSSTGTVAPGVLSPTQSHSGAMNGSTPAALSIAIPRPAATHRTISPNLSARPA
jgi:hypothetical protein